MKKHLSYIIEDPVRYIKYKWNNERLQIDLDTLIETITSDPEMLNKVILEMNERNDKLRLSQAKVMTSRNKSKKARNKSSEIGKQNIENGNWGTTEIALSGVKVQIENGTNLFLSSEMKHLRVKGGRKSVKIQQERGTWETDFRNKGTEAGNKLITCEYCGYTADLRNIKKNHNEKCKQKPEDMQKVLSILPNIFTPGQWQKAFIDCGFNYTSKATYVILHHGLYAYKIENKIYCKIGYIPSEDEIKNLKKTNGKATIEKLEKINKIKSILVDEFKGPDMDRVCLELGFTNSFGRSLLRSEFCVQIYKGIPGSKTNTSIYSFNLNSASNDTFSV